MHFPRAAAKMRVTAYKRGSAERVVHHRKPKHWTLGKRAERLRKEVAVTIFEISAKLPGEVFF